VHRAPVTTACVYAFVGGLADSAFVNWFRSGRVAGLIPTNDGLANVWVCVTPDEFQRKARGDLRGFLAEGLVRTAPQLAEQVLDGRPIHGLRAFPGHLGATHQAHGPGWALVGDACATEDPVSAHGMTKALVGAALLGQALEEIHLGAEEREAMTSYATRRSLLARSMLAPVIETARLDWQEADLAAVHLRAAVGHRAEWDLLDSMPRQAALAAASHAP
jgi:2-polyprenyl-6-methoxyphenol hydroxylase-like FAD-dependent oxidoreductase